MILAIYGAGAMGREAKRVADRMKEYDSVVFIDDDPGRKEFMGCPVETVSAFLGRYENKEDVRVVIAIGEPSLRKDAFKRMKEKGYTGAVLIDPGAQVMDSAEIGEGSVITDDAFIDDNVKIGRNCCVSYNAVIGHDTVMDDHSRIGPGAFVGGHVKIGDDVFIGANASLRDRITIGSGSVVSISSAVLNDMPENATAIGNPARVVFNSEGTYMFAPSIGQAENAAAAAKEAAGESVGTADIVIRYFNAFTDTFHDIDFDPVRFHAHDAGWDSLAQMTLIAELEEAFDVELEGQDPMEVDSYKSGLELNRRTACLAGKIRTALGKKEGSP